MFNLLLLNINNSSTILSLRTDFILNRYYMRTNDLEHYEIFRSSPKN